MQAGQGHTCKMPPAMAKRMSSALFSESKREEGRVTSWAASTRRISSSSTVYSEAQAAPVWGRLEASSPAAGWESLPWEAALNVRTAACEPACLLQALPRSTDQPADRRSWLLSEVRQGYSISGLSPWHGCNGLLGGAQSTAASTRQSTGAWLSCANRKHRSQAITSPTALTKWHLPNSQPSTDRFP